MSQYRQHPKKREQRRRGKELFDENFGVYVLECEPVGLEYVNEVAKSRIGSVPQWAHDAAHYQHVYYVGSTGNIFQRLGNQMDYGAAEFTRLFRPSAVMQVQLCRDESSARDVERRLPETYRTWERRYCYSELRQHESD